MQLLCRLNGNPFLIAVGLIFCTGPYFAFQSISSFSFFLLALRHSLRLRGTILRMSLGHLFETNPFNEGKLAVAFNSTGVQYRAPRGQRRR